MNDPLFGSIALAGLAVAFLHASLPTHWLPFVLAGRRQAWSHNKTLAITALAGSGHVLMTIALGIALAWFGIALDRLTGGVFPFIAAGILICVGLYFVSRGDHGHDHFRGHTHDHHDHHHHDHDHATGSHDGAAVRLASAPRAIAVSDRTVIIGLLTALTLSPCEGFLPVFVAGVKFGWSGFAVLCAVLGIATLAGMMLLTWLTLIGFQHARFDRFERYESKILGTLLISLGIAVLFLET